MRTKDHCFEAEVIYLTRFHCLKSCFCFLFQQTELEQVLDHLLNCTDRLFGAGDSGGSGNISPESKHASNKSSTRREKRHRGPQIDASSPSDGGK